MPGWAGSSWYFLRYMDPGNTKSFASRDNVDYWGQVDLYMGGAEHATGHLLYARFWTKVLYDLGYIGFEEPFKKMINQGMITGRSSKISLLLVSTGIGGRRSFSDPVGDISQAIRADRVPEIYISQELVDEFNDPLKRSQVKRRIEGFLETLGERLRAVNPMWQGRVFLESISVSKRNVPIDFVDNDILDTESYSNSISKERGIEFIVGDSGKFLCDWEIEKMSKSKFNVQTPDELVEKFGADTLRCYEMFLGPVEQSKPWDTKGINGVHNFLRKFWRLFHDKENAFSVSSEAASKEELRTLHKTIRKVTEDLNRYSWNTVVSTLMIAVNELTEQKSNKRSVLEPLCILLSPYAPHMAEELWEKLGFGETITGAPWPAWDESLLADDDFSYPVSFNGKTRFFISLPVEMPKEQVTEAVLSHEQAAKYLEGKTPKKVIVVPNRIVNVVI